MSNDETPQVPSARDRRKAVREKAQQVHVKQSRLRVLRRVLLGVAGLAVVGAATAAVVYALTEMGPRPLVQPANASNDGFSVTAVSGVAATEDAGVDGTTTAAPAAPAEDAATPSPSPSTARAVDIRV